MASELTIDSGMSAAMIFQVALECVSSRLSHSHWAAPRMRHSGAAAPSCVVVVRPAIAAHVEHEDVEQRAVRDFPVDAPGLGLGLPHRHVFAERAAAVRCEQRRIGVGIVAAVLAGPPVVGDLVVVPLREHRHLGVEAAHMRVEQIVFVVAAVVGDRCRDPRFLLGDEVLPRFAVRQLQFALDRAVGIDAVAGMDEEVRPAVAAWSRRCACRRATRRCPSPGPRCRRTRRTTPSAGRSEPRGSARPALRLKWSAQPGPRIARDRRCPDPPGDPPTEPLR